MIDYEICLLRVMRVFVWWAVSVIERSPPNGAPRAKPVVPPKEYPPTPLGAEALRCAGAKASEGYPPVAESAEAAILRFKISTDTAHAFIVRRHRLWPTASTGRARGLLRRRINFFLLFFLTAGHLSNIVIVLRDFLYSTKNL